MNIQNAPLMPLLESIALASIPEKKDQAVANLIMNAKPIWQKNNDELTYGPAPKFEERHLWRNLSHYKSLQVIEDLLVDGHNYVGLSKKAKKNLKTFFNKIYCEKSGFLDSLWSFFKHGLKGKGWISTADKAAKLYSRMFDLEALEKNREAMSYWNLEEYYNQSLFSQDSNGRSRLYTYPAIKNNTPEEKAFYDRYEDITKELKGVGFINGIHNTFEWAEGSAKLIANYGGIKTTNVYNPSHGIFLDLRESFWNWCEYNTRPVRKLHKLWDQFFKEHEKENPGKARFLMFCHSQGAVLVKNALKGYDPVLRKQIDVVCIAPGGFPNPEHCGSLKVYMTPFKNDPIPIIDWYATGCALPPEYIEIVPSLDPSVLHDHSFKSPSFAPYIDKHVQAFVNKRLLPVAPIVEIEDEDFMSDVILC